MKLAICLALFAVTSFVSSQAPTDPNFLLLASPWIVSATVPANLAGANCCAPGGLMYLNKHKYDATSVSLNATEWNGGLCPEFGLTHDYDLIFPFNDTFSYNELATNTNLSTSVNGYVVILNIGNYSNTNGVLSWSLSFNFENSTFGGGICSVILQTVMDPLANESNFLVSHPWQVSASVPANLADSNCCMPEGIIYISQDGFTGQASLNATQWNGDLCTYLSLNSRSDLVLPFSNTSSYNELVTQGNQPAPLNGETLTYNIGNYSDINGTISWSLSISFEEIASQGGVCSVTLMPYTKYTKYTHNLGLGPYFLLLIAIYLLLSH